jgi:predicted amidohydrolase YtcJ
VNPIRVDLLVHDAKIWTGGRVLPGADALAVSMGRVLATGPARELESLATPVTRRIDARGATVTPGLTDAHIHLLAWARSAGDLWLGDAGSPEQVARLLSAHVASRPGLATVVGRGWDAASWPAAPHRRVLDAVCSDRPVLLHSHDFHSLWVNGVALERAGITRDSADPSGGRIERDAAGEPTGVLREHAVRACAALETSTDAADAAGLRDATARLLAMGVTGIHDFEGPVAHRLLRELTLGAGPRVRVLMHLAHADLDAALSLGLGSGTGDDWFRIGAVKLFADGALGSQTAALLEPYAGTDNVGMPLIPAGELRALVARACAGGLALAVHAIGDRAVSTTLDAFAAAGPDLRRPALPSRLEHAQLVHPADLGRFAALGIAASLQPSHTVSDIGLAERWWRDRLDRAYPWRALLDRGATLAFGSDAPVEPPDPSIGLHAAVTRQRTDGTPAGGWLPAQCLTLDQALTAYTEGPARLAGTWPRQGSLAPGSAGDFVVWDADLHALDRARLHAVRPRFTVLAGEIVHESGVAGRAAPESRQEVGT